ncbi:MAG TPA: hypothetical protein VE439_01470, partial [Anaerolineae bacterium]|nr:hypothetical protein [Anaerolineae bacterium]
MDKYEVARRIWGQFIKRRDSDPDIPEDKELVPLVKEWFALPKNQGKTTWELSAIGDAIIWITRRAVQALHEELEKAERKTPRKAENKMPANMVASPETFGRGGPWSGGWYRRPYKIDGIALKPVPSSRYEIFDPFSTHLHVEFLNMAASGLTTEKVEEFASKYGPLFLGSPFQERFNVSKENEYHESLEAWIIAANLFLQFE